MARKSRSSKTVPGSDESIDIPPISKSAAGAATGAVVGAVAGPVGAVFGGIVGAMIGKRAESDEPMMPAIKRTARQAASGVKVAAKTVRSAVPAAKRAVKAIRPARATRSGGKARKKASATKASPARGKKKSASATKGAPRTAQKKSASAKKSARVKMRGGRKGRRR